MSDESLWDVSLDDFDEFSDMQSIPTLLAGVYALYDRYGAIVYIGQSGMVRQRQRAHMKKAWWPSIRRIRAYKVPDVSDRLLLETLLILRHRPLWNRTVKLSINNDGSLTELQFLRATRKRKRRGSRKGAAS